MSEKARPVSGPQLVQIAAAVPMSQRTVERVYDGGGSDYSRERVMRAARELGLPAPGAAARAGAAA
jgi:DNA-binding LacI/PurR family transcriptional regulator